MPRIKRAIHLDALKRCFEFAIGKFARAGADRAIRCTRNIYATRWPQTAFADFSFIYQYIMHDVAVKPFSQLAPDD